MSSFGNLSYPLPGEPLRIGAIPDRRVPLGGLDSGLPFTTALAAEAGLSGAMLTRMVREGDLVRPFKGVYVVSGIEDTVDLRVAAVKLVLPPGAVACDQTAAWLHGADLLPPGAHRTTPSLSICVAPGDARIRVPGVVGGERGLRAADVEEIGGLLVTTPLRTASDLGRVRNLPRALAHVDGMLRLGSFTKEQLLAEVPRFRGMRWVVHLRVVAPLADPRAESPAESMLRFHWVTSGLPAPTPQWPVVDAQGVEVFYLDLADQANGVAAEYDGEEFHGDDRAEHDRERRAWIERHHPILIEVFVKGDLVGPTADPVVKLRSLYRRAGVGPLTRHRM